MFGNWEQIETIMKAVVVIGGAGLSLFQLYNRLPKFRTSLMRDIEILKMLDINDPTYKIIRASIVDRVAEIYNPSSTSFRESRVHSWPHLVFGVLLLCIFGIWTYTLFRDNSWWAVLTGFLAFGGFGNILIAFEDKKAGKTILPLSSAEKGESISRA